MVLVLIFKLINQVFTRGCSLLEVLIYRTLMACILLWMRVNLVMEFVYSTTQGIGNLDIWEYWREDIEKKKQLGGGRLHFFVAERTDSHF